MFDVTLKNKDNNSSVSYLADEIRIHPSGIFLVISKEYGNVNDTIEENTILIIESFKEDETC